MINSSEEYIRALKELGALMDKAEAGTNEGDRLQELAVLVDEYENRFLPITKDNNEP